MYIYTSIPYMITFKQTEEVFKDREVEVVVVLVRPCTVV